MDTGVCSDPEMGDGTGCDDNDAFTELDVCTAGVCVGENPCSETQCTAKNQCHDVGVCTNVVSPDRSSVSASCSDPMSALGTAFDDDDGRTIGDMCVSGTCQGEDRCNTVTCTVLDQCHVMGECDSYTGTCSQPAAPDGTSCDDGNSITV